MLRCPQDANFGRLSKSQESKIRDGRDAHLKIGQTNGLAVMLFDDPGNRRQAIPHLGLHVKIAGKSPFSRALRLDTPVMRL